MVLRMFPRFVLSPLAKVQGSVLLGIVCVGVGEAYDNVAFDWLFMCWLLN